MSIKKNSRQSKQKNYFTGWKLMMVLELFILSALRTKKKVIIHVQIRTLYTKETSSKGKMMNYRQRKLIYYLNFIIVRI